MHLSPLLGRTLQGSVTVPADKSIAHRSILFGALAKGTSTIRATTLGRDNFASIRAMKQLGIAISGNLPSHLAVIARHESLDRFQAWDLPFCEVTIEGRGKSGLSKSDAVIDCGNSGTSARLLTGILSGQSFDSTLTGDHSLIKRPFKRVTEPLSQMGASFSSDMLPITITGSSSLVGIQYVSPRASAQVKSAILLAGLYARGTTSVVEPTQSRDHTERMLTSMGCDIRCEEGASGTWSVSLPSGSNAIELSPLDIEIPGDFSSASFFLVAGSIVPNANIELRDVGINPTRIGLLEILRAMGADILVLNERTMHGETIADLQVSAASLRGVTIAGDAVVRAIDEIPIIAVAAAVAEGKTTIRDASELRVKESDRLTMTASVLRTFGCQVDELPDGLVIYGNPELKKPTRFTVTAHAPWHMAGDHRISMAGAVFEFLRTGGFTIYDPGSVETSFPSFLELFEALAK